MVKIAPMFDENQTRLAGQTRRYAGEDEDKDSTIQQQRHPQANDKTGLTKTEAANKIVGQFRQDAAKPERGQPITGPRHDPTAWERSRQAKKGKNKQIWGDHR